MSFEFAQTLLVFFRTISQILTAGIAITALSLLLFLFTLNMKDRVIKSFALILISLGLIYFSEALGSSSTTFGQNYFWLNFQWIGIILLPATYFHFSDALLATTGKPSRGRRTWLVRIFYLLSSVALGLLVTGHFIGPLVQEEGPTPHLAATPITHVFTVVYLVAMLLSWFNFARAYQRTTTSTSRRRMVYIIVGGLAPALGSYPFLLFGSELAAQHSLFFWMVVSITNLLLGGFLVILAYAVAFFGVSWPDRLVRSRLFMWIMRGPVIASFALAITTIVRRFGEIYGVSYSAFVPISMVATVILGQYLVTIFSPLWERWFFYGNMRAELDILQKLENSLITRQDLSQFLEMVLAAICDRLQAPGAYLVAIGDENLELVVTVGDSNIDDLQGPTNVTTALMENGNQDGLFHWDENLLVPLKSTSEDDQLEMYGILVICDAADNEMDEEQREALHILSDRASMALRDRYLQNRIFETVEALNPQIDLIQRLRAAASYDENVLILGDIPYQQNDLVQVVKEALSHYWGGPRLTDSPLLKLKIVQDALITHNGNGANALRSILKDAIEHIRPEGERHFTAEWILYNILEMKFLEGRKVREIALRLAMSEADLYRKQKVAIEVVAKAIMEMETQARHHSV